MKYKLMIESVGDDQWTFPKGFGQTVSQRHEFEVFFEDTDQTVALSSVFDRAISALKVPRPALLLADLLTAIIESRDCNLSDCEQDFYNAAEKVIAFWKKSDEELNELVVK